MFALKKSFAQICAVGVQWNSSQNLFLKCLLTKNQKEIFDLFQNYKVLRKFCSKSCLPMSDNCAEDVRNNNMSKLGMTFLKENDVNLCEGVLKTFSNVYPSNTVFSAYFFQS